MLANTVLGLALMSRAMGTWSSGGGELIKDAHNPWFLQNTTMINYCTLTDQQHSNVTDSKFDYHIRRAFSYWQESFSKAVKFGVDLNIAGQKLNKVPCTLESSGKADIVFQLGLLSQEQKQFLLNPQRYGSITVRTEYDKVQLRGKGFIYLAAEEGPLALEGDQVKKYPWSQGERDELYLTLVHELGHVFGLPHNNKKPQTMDVMSTRFVEYVLDKRKQLGSLSSNYFSVEASSTNSRPQFLCYHDSHSSKYVREFFGISYGWNCLGTLLKDGSLEIWVARDLSSIGSGISIGSVQFLQESAQIKKSFSLWLSESQKVIPQGVHLVEPSFSIREISGVYKSYYGFLERPVGLIIDPTKEKPLLEDLKVSGRLHGRQVVNLFNHLAL